MCETMTDADNDSTTEPKATPWPKVNHRKKMVEWPPEQDESTWSVKTEGEPGEE
jgi:hypothetical protein